MISVPIVLKKFPANISRNAAWKFCQELNHRALLPQRSLFPIRLLEVSVEMAVKSRVSVKPSLERILGEFWDTKFSQHVLSPESMNIERKRNTPILCEIAQNSLNFLTNSEIAHS